MQKKFLSITMLIFLSVIFMLISVLVFLFRKNNVLLKKKLKVGGMIITLTSMLSSCNLVSPPVYCYVPAPVDYVFIDNSLMSGSTIVLDLNVTNKIIATVSGRSTESKTFSYVVKDLNDIVMQRGNIQPKDGEWDEEDEGFEIIINDNIESGDFVIYFYNVEVESLTADTYYHNSYNLQIIK